MFSSFFCKNLWAIGLLECYFCLCCRQIYVTYVLSSQLVIGPIWITLFQTEGVHLLNVNVAEKILSDFIFKRSITECGLCIDKNDFYFLGLRQFIWMSIGCCIISAHCIKRTNPYTCQTYLEQSFTQNFKDPYFETKILLLVYSFDQASINTKPSKYNSIQIVSLWANSTSLFYDERHSI